MKENSDKENIIRLNMSLDDIIKIKQLENPDYLKEEIDYDNEIDRLNKELDEYNKIAKEIKEKKNKKLTIVNNYEWDYWGVTESIGNKIIENKTENDYEEKELIEDKDDNYKSLVNSYKILVDLLEKTNKKLNKKCNKLKKKHKNLSKDYKKVLKIKNKFVKKSNLLLEKNLKLNKDLEKQYDIYIDLHGKLNTETKINKNLKETINELVFNTDSKYNKVNKSQKKYKTIKYNTKHTYKSLRNAITNIKLNNPKNKIKLNKLGKKIHYNNVYL